MAKMKPEFANLVEDSFNDGFKREPEMIPQQEPETIAIENPTENPENETPETLSKDEVLLKKLRMGETDAVNEVLYKESRKTYFITEFQRECIEVMARVDDTIIQKVVQDALNKYFENNPRVVEEARREVIRKKILRLEKEIKEKGSK